MVTTIKKKNSVKNFPLALEWQVVAFWTPKSACCFVEVFFIYIYNTDLAKLDSGISDVSQYWMLIPTSLPNNFAA